MPNPEHIEDLSGQRFGGVVVLEYVGQTKTRNKMWKVKCVLCGSKFESNASNFKYRKRAGCPDCSKHIRNAKISRHGMCKGSGPSRTWRSWFGAKQRTANKNLPCARDYVGRGIKMCERFKVFELFLQDLGPCPPGLTLDRHNNNGHYSCGKCRECIENAWPSNCRWATRKEQSNNTRGNHMIEYNGKTQSMMMWSEELGLKYRTIRSRLAGGWTPERTFTTPPRHQENSSSYSSSGA